MFAVARNRGPLADLHQLDRLFDAFNTWPVVNGNGGWTPPVDVVEDKDTVRIVAELPGVKPEDVKITVEHDVLSIRGEKHVERGENGGTSGRYERTSGAFERHFTLPDTVDAERIEARYEHGMLYVTLPRAERAKPRQIMVKVQA